MSTSDESASAGEPVDQDRADADDLAYLRLVESSFSAEWLSPADVEAYDGLSDDSDPPGPTPSSQDQS